ncbi:hypothetical protein AVEN_10628-1 [Araneus ventricosus]|uniref:Uncharacterized protein n=1 Tax=Araneus ventricosus TaxID=182803 RepID=A0A4Y2IV01_ARAVE|nr:hypothetical protein AVEN_10628-1 [Araneus ventricosus]
MILNLGQMTRTTPELATPLQTSAPHKREDVCPSTYDLSCNRPNTRRIFSGVGFPTWIPPIPKPSPPGNREDRQQNLKIYLQMQLSFSDTIAVL